MDFRDRGTENTRKIYLKAAAKIQALSLSLQTVAALNAWAYFTSQCASTTRPQPMKVARAVSKLIIVKGFSGEVPPAVKSVRRFRNPVPRLEPMRKDCYEKA